MDVIVLGNGNRKIQMASVTKYSSLISKWLHAHWVILTILSVGFTLYLLISILKHLSFNSTGYDLVIFDQAVRGYSELSAPSSSFRGYDNLLGDHFHPILMLLAPLYWIVDSPIMLLIAQAVLLVVAAIPIYLFSQRRFSNIISSLFVISFILSPLILRGVYFDFHEVAFAVPLIAWAIYLIDIKRFGIMYIPLGLLLLVKENLSLTVAFFGIYLLLLKKWLHGLILIILGVTWFFVSIKIIIPFFAGPNKSFNYWTYAQLGSDVPSAIQSIIKDPFHAATILVTPFVKITTFIKTFGMTLGLSFISPIVILTIPTLLERFLSSNENYWYFHFHYGVVLAPIIVMAAIDGLYRLRNVKFIRKYYGKISLSISLCITLVAIVAFMVSPMAYIFKPSSYRQSNDQIAGYSTLAQIPDKTSLCTTNHIAPHTGQHSLTLIGQSPTDEKLSCEYIIVSSKLDQTPSLTNTLNEVKGDYVLVSSEESWSLYQRK